MKTTEETYQEKYARAKARVGEIRAFYNHVAFFAIINIALAGVNYWHNQFAFPWFLFPLLGWGIGLLSHAAGTFRFNPFVSKEWEERKIQELMKQQDNLQ